MNNLTFEIVTQVAQEHKAAARKNDLAFDFKVRNAHWDEMIGRYGWQLKERALRLWRQYHPEMFVWDEDCWVLDDGNVWYATCDYVISTIVVRVLKRKISREPALQLEDWGDLPKQVADPQIRMP